MEQNFKNYIRVKFIDQNYRERIDDFEVTFDKYNKINVFVGGYNSNSFGSRWFEYKGRSITRMLEKIKKHIIVPHNPEQWTIHDIGYEQFILEVIDVQIPDNPKENEIFEKYSDLDLGMCEDYITEFLPQFKSDVLESVKKEPGFEWKIELRYDCHNADKGAYICIIGSYGYNKYGKTRFKINRFWCNPGGRFGFYVDRYYFTRLQNLIKEYIENEQ